MTAPVRPLLPINPESFRGQKTQLKIQKSHFVYGEFNRKQNEVVTCGTLDTLFSINRLFSSNINFTQCLKAFDGHRKFNKNRPARKNCKKNILTRRITLDWNAAFTLPKRAHVTSHAGTPGSGSRSSVAARRASALTFLSLFSAHPTYFAHGAKTAHYALCRGRRDGGPGHFLFNLPR